MTSREKEQYQANKKIIGKEVYVLTQRKGHDGGGWDGVVQSVKDHETFCVQRDNNTVFDVNIHNIRQKNEYPIEHYLKDGVQPEEKEYKERFNKTQNFNTVLE